MSQSLKLSVQTSHPESIEDLFGTEVLPGEAELMVSDKMAIYYLSQTSKPGILTTEFMIDLVINLGVGVSSGLVAAWIYENLCKQGENKVLVKEERVILVTKGDVEIYIKEKIERSG